MPIELSPHFGQMVANRLFTMWRAMWDGDTLPPKPFFIFEFGAGTGVLAHDILTHLQTRHPRMYVA